MTRESVKQAVEANPIIGGIYHQLLDSSLNYQEALQKACVMIYEYNAKQQEMNKKISAGYVRANTSHLSWKSKQPIQPVDDGEWLKTGASNG